jgi:hypothetical protein
MISAAASAVSTKTANTIDEKHTEMMIYFHRIETEIIPDLYGEIKRLNDTIKQMSQSQLDQYLDVRDKIHSIKREIRELKQKKKNYFLENSKYVFQYFEQKQKISGQTAAAAASPQQTVELLPNTSAAAKSNSANAVQHFFKIKTKSPQEHTETINTEKYAQSRKIYQNYWRNVNGEIPNIQDFVIPADVCQICNSGELIPQDEEGILICNNDKCGKFITYIVDNAKPTNKEPPNEVSYTAYIRLNHFKEILSQFQAKETTQIPEEVIKNIKLRIKRERIHDLSLLNYDKMREILRKLGYNKYFEHIQYINSLFGIKPPIMDDQLHETLCVLFISIQQPYALYCPNGRTNFFNYAYILHQLLVLLDQTQYIPYISLLKDDTKQREQDAIWKNVCAFLDWEFIPSI